MITNEFSNTLTTIELYADALVLRGNAVRPSFSNVAGRDILISVTGLDGVGTTIIDLSTDTLVRDRRVVNFLDYLFAARSLGALLDAHSALDSLAERTGLDD